MQIFENGTPRHYYIFDLLKALGSITVLLYHYPHIFYRSPQYESGTILQMGGFSDIIFNYGMLAVELFYLASGFMFACSRLEAIRGRRTSFRLYLGKQLRKFYPIFFISTLLCLALQTASEILTGHMLLGFANYHLFDIANNFLLIESGLYSASVPLNVPGWFLTPLIACYILFYFIAKIKDQELHFPLFCGLALLGGICIYQNYQLPFLNDRMGRGLYAFFGGVILYFIFKRAAPKIQLAGKAALLGSGLVFACFIIKGYEGNPHHPAYESGYGGLLYLAAVPAISLLVLYLLSVPAIEKFLSRERVQKLYQPLYRLSYPIFCSHYVILTFISFLSNFKNLNPYFNQLWFLGVYLLLSILLAILLKKCASPITRVFIKHT